MQIPHEKGSFSRLQIIEYKRDAIALTSRIPLPPVQVPAMQNSALLQLLPARMRKVKSPRDAFKKIKIALLEVRGNKSVRKIKVTRGH